MPHQTLPAAPMVTTPPRGSGVIPAWFEIHASGWICSDPNCPSEYEEELGHPAEYVNTYALRHLNDHHPGWKAPCSCCGTPQWNSEGSPRCFWCR
ncbi:hypothetical protein [Nocardiopsis sp. CA-288880]|uniref:hypothetical protein n=1 Tax=Nocardiopsis sp. CA-288880 TaxID=3239995 RepID=UPI003D96CC72